MGNKPSRVCVKSRDAVEADEPNDKDMWPPSVMIFNEEMSAEEIKAKIAPTSDTFKPNAKYDGVDGESVPNPIATFSSKEKHFASGENPAPHHALLFLPGTYKDVDFEVGYYVQMAGLGASADDVKFVGKRSGPFVPALNKDLHKTEGGTINYAGSGLSLDTFWRCAENFYSASSDRPLTCWVTNEDEPDLGKGFMWAVSQAAPLRRVHVNTDLWFHDAGAWASGGFFANSLVEGRTCFGSQQQWICRNVNFKGGNPNGQTRKDLFDPIKNDSASLNTVYVGCTGGGLPEHGLHQVEGKDRATTVVDPDIRVEKPFVTYEEGCFKLRVPAALDDSMEVVGPHILAQGTDDVRDFSAVKLGIPNPPKNIDNKKVYNELAAADERKTQELQAALDQGKDLVLCPGDFFLTKSLEVTMPNQVILGLGLANLVAPQDGSPCIRVKPKTPGVRIAGIMVEASVQKSNHASVASFIEIGETGVIDPGNKKNPVVLTDIFARVGGANLDRTVSTDVMIRIHSGNVVGDNLWLWRADHVRLDPGPPKEKPNDENFPYYHQTVNRECPVNTALEVHGDDVRIYGLFCEHTLHDQLLWTGERGKVYFYQCELPYDVMNKDFEGYVGYNVHTNVQEHVAKGVGVYCNFTMDDVRAQTGIKHRPTTEENDFLFTFFLNNRGSIETVLNENNGQPVDKDSKGPSFAVLGRQT